MGQFIDYESIKAKLDTIVNDGEAIKTNLNAMDLLIQETVGNGGTAWSGESASAFRSSWEGLAAELPDFVTTVQNQARNVDSMLVKTRDTDTASGGTVTE